MVVAQFGAPLAAGPSENQGDAATHFHFYVAKGPSGILSNATRRRTSNGEGS